jgi:hypothetical protein
MGYCGSCVQYEESYTGKCRCRKLNIPCKAGQKACMYFEKKVEVEGTNANVI